MNEISSRWTQNIPISLFLSFLNSKQKKKNLAFLKNSKEGNLADILREDPQRTPDF